jgi:hypothetical protein
MAEKPKTLRAERRKKLSAACQEQSVGKRAVLQSRTDFNAVEAKSAKK